MTKCRYSTNWMGPVSIDWYKQRGLTTLRTVTLTETLGKGQPGDQIQVDDITEHYSCGRIDVRGADLGTFGDEIGVPPMRSEDWSSFGDWLDTFETDHVWSLKDLVWLYERANPRIRWHQQPEWYDPDYSPTKVPRD